MVWAKIDDRLHSSAKWRACSKGARALWTTALSWCAAQETDGFLPAHMLPALEGTRAEARSLVSCGLWEDADGGWRFANWAEYQPTRAQLDEKRRVERERIANARASKKRVGANTPQTRNQVGDVSALPDPTRPDPSPNGDVEEATPDGVAKKSGTQGHRLPDGWTPPPEEIARARQDYARDVDLKAEHEIFTDYWGAQPGVKGRKTDWVGTWRNWMKRKQSQLPQNRPPFPKPPTNREDNLAYLARMKAEQDRLEIEQ